MSLRYKILISILVLVVIAQWIYIFMRKPAPAVTRKPEKAAVSKKVSKPAAVTKGNIAIVLDDWGYNLSNLPVIEQIPYPLTLSVLPNLPYSLKVANALHERGFEIILHLPMEPLQKVKLEKNTILTTMDSQTIKSIIENNLSTFPYIRGISNHMGSRATEDNRTMQIVMSILKNKNLYFLDSFVTSRSVAKFESFRSGVSFVKRDIFLDNQADPAYIKQQLSKLMSQARQNGYAVGIGHDRKTTLEVLQQVMPEIVKEGYRFVYLSDMVK
ncbi:MAG: divergent polysaccharide deacetylase family protein [Candidatus Omnitrophota bacterium]